MKPTVCGADELSQIGQSLALKVGNCLERAEEPTSMVNGWRMQKARGIPLH